MEKRIVAFTCILALLVGLCPIDALAETDKIVNTYQVGYAKKDINPWTDPENPSVDSVIDVRVTSGTDSDARACDGLMDDNGDGVVDTNDGLFTTCVSVTDAWDNTVLFISVDTLQGYNNCVNAARAAIVEKLGRDVISEDQIVISGSHTHCGPNLYSIAAENAPESWKTYYQYIVDQITAAAVEAYHDRAPAVMKKGSINGRESTAAMGYNNGKGYKMTYIRHYDITSEAKSASGEIVQKNHVAGSNFGGGVAVGNVSVFGKYDSKTYYRITETSHAVEADDNMHLLTFDFAEGSDKMPIVMVNWRAHPTTNAGVESKKASSDYVNSLRYNLEKAGYRASFIQGAGGNTLIYSYLHSDWRMECDNTTKYITNVYGRLLSEIALDCIENNMTEVLSADKIKTHQLSFRGEIQKESEAMVAAAQAVQDYYDTNAKYPSFPYKLNGATINSRYHASSILTRSKATDGSYNTQEINVFTLGDSVLFITAPNELSDRYDINGSLDDADNDWHELVDEATYGTPFVITHANGSFGYIPNARNYTYNSAGYINKDGVVTNGGEILGAGSYEANVSRFVQGTGEKLIDTYAEMIQTIKGDYDRIAMCEACGRGVEWKPLFAESTYITKLGTGHYYLTENILRPGEGSGEQTQKLVYAGDSLCINLNGYTLETEGRTFYLYKDGKLNLMDSPVANPGSGGAVRAYSGYNNPGGGLIMVASGSVFNLYGGMLEFVRDDTTNYGTGVGGIVSLSGTMNMYGGIVLGAELVDSSYSFPTDGCGGAIFVYGGAVLNMYGGSVKSGTTPDGIENGGMGPCIYMSAVKCKINLYNDASIENIYCRYNNGSNITVNGEYAGRAAIRFDPSIQLFEGLDVGDWVNDGPIDDAKLTCVNSGYSIFTSGNNLILETDTAAVGDCSYNSLQEAVDAADGRMIRLLENVTNAVNVRQNTYIDLNGCSITGKITVAEGSVLYCMDSATDDYTVSDGQYGKLTNVTGAVGGIPVESELAVDGYLKITEDSGVSFHRVNLQLAAMTLRAADAGVYYRSTFACDEIAAKLVSKFGVALSVKAVPSVENLADECILSDLEGFGSGGVSTSKSSTLLTGVMKTENAEAVNAENANIPVHGRAYILLDDGTYLFGAPASRSFRQQVEGVNSIWDTLTAEQQSAAVDMYKTYTSVMKHWNISNIIAAA